MADKELLALAAKAAGIVVIGYVDQYDDYYWKGPSWGLQIDGLNGVWNPLEDDGDALRLAVTLRMMIDQFPNRGEPSAYAYTPKGSAMQPYEDDPASATRRAVVRAAAAIGKWL